MGPVKSQGPEKGKTEAEEGQKKRCVNRNWVRVNITGFKDGGEVLSFKECGQLLTR